MKPILCLLLFLAACSVQNTADQTFLGRLELTLSAQTLGQKIQSQAAPLADSVASFNNIGFEDFVAADAKRYLKATFEVTNLSNNPWQNLTLYAYSQNLADQGGAAVKNLSNFVGGNTSTNAKSLQPTHGMSGTPPAIVPLEADFQAFTPLETANLQSAARTANIISPTDTLLEYGFVVRQSATNRVVQGINCNPLANPKCNVGRVTIAYRIPDNQVSSAYGFKATFVLVNEPNTRVTRGLNESTSSAETRASALSASEVVLLGEDTDSSSVGTTLHIANTRIAEELNYLLPPAVLYTVGDIAGCAVSYQDEATAAMLGALTGQILTLGDNVYSVGTTANYTNCYDPSWGVLKSRTHPVIGNHDYNGTSNADYLTYFGASAGSAGAARYSFNYGGWHFIALDSNCSLISCAAANTQGTWLSTDLATNPNPCVAAAWHHPRFSSSSSHGSDANLTAFWSILETANADLVLSGHDHTYERLAPMLSDGTLSSNGMRSFVVGTGGAPQYAFGTPVTGSEYRENTKYGALKLELYPSGMRWTFVATDNSVGDSGQLLCH
jgi:hypothetical protein